MHSDYNNALIIATKIITLLIAFIILYIYCIFSIIKNEFTNNNKLIFLLTVLLIPPLGIPAYLIFKNKYIIKKDKEIPQKTFHKIDNKIYKNKKN